MAALGGSCQGERDLYETQAARLGIWPRPNYKHGLVCRLSKTVGTALSAGWAMHKEQIQWWTLVSCDWKPDPWRAKVVDIVVIRESASNTARTHRKDS